MGNYFTTPNQNTLPKPPAKDSQTAPVSRQINQTKARSPKRIQTVGDLKAASNPILNYRYFHFIFHSFESSVSFTINIQLSSLSFMKQGYVMAQISKSRAIYG